MFPVNRPRKVKCPAGCDHGKFYYIGDSELCPSCAGSGRDLTEDLYLAWCRTCQGRGKVTKAPTICNMCAGSGWVWQ